jgi:hypothetical protein
MLTVDQARRIADHWRPQFVEEVSFEQSWSRFFSMVGDPTPDKLETWLAKDQAKDAVVHAGIVREPLLPALQHLIIDLGECPRCGGDPNVCRMCHGLGWVRRDLPVGHADFGKAVACPSCR